MDYERGLARNRQACGQGGKLLPANFPEATTGEARDKAGERLGVSGRCVGDAERMTEKTRRDGRVFYSSGDVVRYPCTCIQ